MQTLTKIDLSDADAKLFLQFQKRYAFIQLMESIGAFDLFSASLIINYDAQGGIRSVEKHQHFKL